ncbi:hypothetical protein NP233_g3550 [Leucocoprinus birnbaumii]|uniref:Natural resistance-associated macrophage protein n=1 Tax=Leucocoprinus birnbaumii TaxID=56174 RepID=A0AAD5VWA7_9AGAR|nr:hypothetical protein NP233_g3550 [Leucocoprinus birnbaumii]
MDSPIKETPQQTFQELPSATPLPRKSAWKRAWDFTLLHIKHTGVGVVCAVAYFDPSVAFLFPRGNWSTNMQGGSEYGYKLLFIVLMSGIFAIYLQVLACRLGCVTGVDLAGHTRLLLYRRTNHPRLFRWLTLYPLYVVAEVAIIATDLAELLGSAIALCLLFPKLQLWQGVLITASDVFLVLLLGDPLAKEPARLFEVFIGFMVIAILVCMGIVVGRVDIVWAKTFEGYLPSKQVFTSGGLYDAIGIIGATVMPHSLFLGSALATQDRMKMRALDDDFTKNPNSTESSLDSPTRSKKMLAEMKTSIGNFFKTPPPSAHATDVTRHSERENNPYDFVRAHVYHGIADMTISLLGFAVVINSLILILASAVFYYGQAGPGDGPASLFDAYDLIQSYVGKGAATLFAIALLASGQSASFIATIAGQAVAEGFVKWRVSAVVSRLLTRALAIIPSMVVAIAIGRDGIDALLVASQVTLSVALPFVTFPLLYCTGSKEIMKCRKTVKDGEVLDTENGEEWVDFSNGLFSKAVGWIIWLLILLANLYVLFEMMISSAQG